MPENKWDKYKQSSGDKWGQYKQEPKESNVDKLISQLGDIQPEQQEEKKDATLLQKSLQETTAVETKMPEVQTETFEQKKQTAEYLANVEEEYKKQFGEIGETVLFEAQELPNNVAKKAYESVRDSIINAGSKRFSFTTEVERLKGLSKGVTDITAATSVMKDNIKYVYDNVFNTREKGIADLQNKSAQLSIELKKNPNDIQKLKDLDKVNFQLNRLKGDAWKPLYDANGELIDKDWTEEQAKEVEAKVKEYSTWDLNSIRDLMNELIAKDKYIQDVKNRHLELPFREESRRMTEFQNALTSRDQTGRFKDLLNKTRRIDEKGNQIRLELQALSHAYILNQDPATLSKSFTDFVGRGFVTSLEDMIGTEIINTESELQEAYNIAVQKSGGQLTEDQLKEADRTIVDKLGMTLGASVPYAVAIGAETYLTRQATSALSATRFISRLRALGRMKMGRTGQAFMDMVGRTASVSAAYGMTPGEEVTAEMGAGEQIAQELLDFKFKGKSVGRLREFLTRTMAGMTTETVAEFSGEFAKAMKENGMDAKKAFDQAFGSTNSERIENILLTMMMTGAFSGASNTSSLFKMRDAIAAHPDSEPSDIKKANEIINDVENQIEPTKTESDSKETGTKIEEAVSEEKPVGEELQRNGVRDTEKSGVETEERKVTLQNTTTREIKNPAVRETSGKSVEKGEIVYDGKVVGDINVGTTEEGNLRMNNIQLNPEEQGKGIGPEVYREINRKANEQGGVLESTTDMREPARKVWDKLVESGEAEKVGDRYQFKKTMAASSSEGISISAPTEQQKAERKARAQFNEKLRQEKKKLNQKLKDLKNKVSTDKQARKEKSKSFTDYVRNVKKELGKLGYKGQEVQSLIQKATDIATKIQDAGIKREDYVETGAKRPRKSYEDLINEFDQAIDNVVTKAIDRETVDTKKRVKDIIGKRRSRSQSGKKTGTSVDADTALYFEELNKVIKATPEEMLTMSLEAQEAVSTGREGTEKYDRAVATLEALEDAGGFEEMTLDDALQLEDTLKGIEKSGRESLKEKKAQRKTEIEAINSEVEESLDPNIVPDDLVTNAAERNKRNVAANTAFKNKVKKTFSSLGIKSKDAVRKSFGRFMEWNFMAKTMLSFLDHAEVEFGTGKLNELIVGAMDKARNIHLKGMYAKQDAILGKFMQMFTGSEMGSSRGSRNDAKRRFRQKAFDWQHNTMDIEITKDGQKEVLEGVTYDEAMRIYAWSKNADLQNELLEKYGLTPDYIEQMIDKVGAEEKAFVDWVTEDFMDEYHNETNQSYKELFYSNMPRVENYFPIRREGIRSEVDVDSDAPITNVVAATMASALKRRGKAAADLQLVDKNKTGGFLSGLFGHINEMEHFKAYAKTARNINVAINNPKLKTALNRYGLYRPLLKIIKTSMSQDIETGIKDPILSKLLDRYVVTALGAKLNMTLKQVTSFVNALADYKYKGTGSKIPGVNTAAGLAHIAKITATSMLKTRKVDGKRVRLFTELYNASPKFRERVDSYGISNADLISDKNMSSPYNKMTGAQKIREALMSPIKWGDQAAIIIGYGAVYENMINNGFTKEEAVKAFEAYEETQQTRSAIHRTLPQLNKNAFTRLFTSFKSSPILYLNQSFGSMNAMVRQMKRGKMPKRADFKRFIINYAISNALFQAAASLPAAFRDDDDFWDDIKRSVTIGPLNGIMFLGSFIEWAYDVAFEDKASLEFGIDVERPFNKMVNTLSAQEKDLDEKLAQAAITAAYLMNIPGETLSQAGEGVVELGDGDELTGIFRLLGYTDYAIEGPAQKGGRKKLSR